MENDLGQINPQNLIIQVRFSKSFVQFDRWLAMLKFVVQQINSPFGSFNLKYPCRPFNLPLS